MEGVFGASFSKVFQTFIDAIQDKYRDYEGGFLRFLIEEVLFRYGQLMSEPWSENDKLDYDLPDIHSPGNAAALLTTLVKFLVPLKGNQQEFIRKKSGTVTRVTKTEKLDKDKTSTPVSNDKNKASKSKNKLKRDRRVANKSLPLPVTNKVPSANYCLRRLKKALNVSPQDCSFGVQCRFLHTIPTSANKVEIQGVIGNVAHPGSQSEKKLINDALALL